MIRSGCKSSINAVQQQLRHAAITAAHQTLPIKLFSIATSAPGAPMAFTAQLPNTDGPHKTFELRSSNGLRMQLPMEVLLDHDATTFDANSQRHSIVSPSLAEGMQCEIHSMREIQVLDGPSSFTDRLTAAVKEEMINNQPSKKEDEVERNSHSTSSSSPRYLLIEWSVTPSSESLQPTHSPYSIMADPQGIEINSCWYSAVPIFALEPIVRVVADGSSIEPSTLTKATGVPNDVKLEHYFDQMSFGQPGVSLSPMFYRNIRVPIQYANVFHQEEADVLDVPTNSNKQAVSSSGEDTILPRRVPIDQIFWDHRLMFGSAPQVNKLGNSFEEGFTEQVVSTDPKISHASLRANMKRQPPPDFTIIRTDSTDAKFPEAAKKLVRMIENFGFGVLEDVETLSGFPTPREEGGAPKPLLYTRPTADEADNANANALIVDHRAAKAEQLITKVFGHARNCHYGLFSTWSNGNRWKYEDLSDDPALMRQLDAHNAKNGHETRHHTSEADTTQSGGPSCSLRVLNKSGSNPHADGAYSGIHLDLHSDNTYFLEVPRLQAYGCIFTHTTKTIGGETSLVDGARVALEAARMCSPKAVSTIAGRKLAAKYSVSQRKRFLNLLCTVPVCGRYEKEDHFYNGFKPIITLTKGATPELLIELAAAMPPSTTAEGVPSTDYIAWCRRLQHALGTSRPLFDSISFNNSDRTPLNPFISNMFAATTNATSNEGKSEVQEIKEKSHGMCVDLTNPDYIREFYQAYEWFHSLVHDPELAIHFTLKPGQMLFFDNQRTLHGRLEFSGPRVMCGSYIASDEYYSTLKAMCDSVNAHH